jgi:hypothetical protein
VRGAMWHAQGMPMRATREDPFIRLFLSAYDKGSWAGADSQKADAIDRTNPAVDQIATRKSDGKVLAIEHTIVEPFVGDKKDVAFFELAGFFSMSQDPSLLVPRRWLRVFVPVGTLDNQPQGVRDAIKQSVYDWIKFNGRTVPDGTSQHCCSVDGTLGKPSFEIVLTVKAVPLTSGPTAQSGALNVWRQQVQSNLSEVIRKSLEKKLPKLVNTTADKRILILERQHMNLDPLSMIDEIERIRPSRPNLESVNEIWIMETGEAMFGAAFGGTHVRFELYSNGNEIASFDFNQGKLTMRYEDGISEVMQNQE